MSLVHPVISPQVVLRACKGKFFGTSQEWVALLYSNRIVFSPVDRLQDKIAGSTAVYPEDSPEEVSISIPQPPMTLGSPADEILPNVGGAFFAVGRNRDMLALQFSTCLAILSINSVTQMLELQGIWGLPKVKEATKMGRSGHHRVSSAVSLVSLADGSPSSSTPIGRSGLFLSPQFPLPKASPDGTNIFVATRHPKSHQPVLLVLSSYGKEIVRLDCDYLDILTLGWISDEVVYFVYMNAKFHKKFQTCRLTNKSKASGFLGMGRKHVKPSFMFETNVPLAVDYQPSTLDVLAGPDLVFKDCVLLGTRQGGYVRVNIRANAWEPVLNIKNVVGAVALEDSTLIVHTSAKVTTSAPTAASDFLFSVVTDGTVHAIRAPPEIGACLSSKHNIDGERRYALKLLHLGGDMILDFKRLPFRLYRFHSSPTSKLSLADRLPVPPTVASKLVLDFLVKTEQGLYTREPNGDDDCIVKIMDRESQLTVKLDRPGLVTIVRRDIRSLIGAYNSMHAYGPEVHVYDESQSKPNKLKLKSKIDFKKEFDGKYAKWNVFEIKALHRNVYILTLTSECIPNFKKQYDTWADDFTGHWAVFLLNFNGATTKRDPVPPKANLLLAGSAPEIAPRMLAVPANNNKHRLHVFHSKQGTFRYMLLDANSHGEYNIVESKDNLSLFSLDQAEGVTFFTDTQGPLEGLYLTGTFSDDKQLRNVLLVEANNLTDGNSVVLSGADPFKTTIWMFDSGGMQFREYVSRDIPPERMPYGGRQEQIIRSQQQRSQNPNFLQLSPEFQRRFFVEVSSNNDFRPLPEVPALICRGIGYGVDAEVYIKTPDNGLYAMFRIQNKRLLESLAKLERIILDRKVGSWLTDEFRSAWISQMQSSSMIAGSAFGAYWRLDESEQEALCQAAGVDSDLIKKLRPP